MPKKYSRSARKMRSRKMRRKNRITTNTLLKMLGGGNLSGGNCDLTPLRTTDEIVQKYDRHEIPEIYEKLNLENVKCNLLSGAHNIVCQKRCAEGEDTSQIFIYRQSKSPYVKFPKEMEPAEPVLITESQIIEKFFSFYHPEMKLQIELAEKGLAPNVFMYGILSIPLESTKKGGGIKRMITHDDNETEDRDSAKLHKSEPVRRPYYLFSIMEKKLDTFELFGRAFNAHCTAYKTLEHLSKLDNKESYSSQYSEYVNKMNSADRIIDSIWRGILDLYIKVSDHGKLFFDLKMENTVAEITRSAASVGQNIKIFMIDCDPRFIISENALKNAIELANIPSSPAVIAQIRKKIMLYLFSSFTLSNLPDNYGFDNEVAFPIISALKRFAILRNKISPSEIVPQLTDTVAVLSVLYDNANNVFAKDEKITQITFINTIHRYNICSKPHMCFLAPKQA